MIIMVGSNFLTLSCLKINKTKQIIVYKIDNCKVKGKFEIINDINENFTLINLVDAVVNINHSVSIVGNWIFDYNYKKVSPLTT